MCGGECGQLSGGIERACDKSDDAGHLSRR
jgi:hypothetical protein